jgi:beta-lactamase superfamily II metal-dependent hydrolase
MSETVFLAAYFLDVGQGDCSFIIPPDQNATVLFDCADAYVAERFVKDHDISHLGAVVLSHLDHDHIGGMLPFLKIFFESGRTVGRVYVEIDRDRSELAGAKAALIKQLLRWDADGRLHLARMEPQALSTGHNWSIDLILPKYASLLAMGATGGLIPNSCSAALRLVCGGQAVLIGGDAPLDSWGEARSDEIEAKVFRMPHHGGRLTEGSKPKLTIEELYDRIGAEICFCSVGTRNSHAHPLPEHVSASQRGGKSRTLCTQLTSRCHPDPLEHREVALENASGVEYPYRHRIQLGDPHRHRPKEESPCAGSAMVMLHDSGSLDFEPRSEDWHDGHVALMDTPLCRQHLQVLPG